MNVRPAMTCRAIKVSGMPTPSFASNLAMMVTAPFPRAAISMKAIVVPDFSPEIEFRIGYKVTPMRNVTSRICSKEIEEFKRSGESKSTTAGAIAGATELTDAVLFATMEKRMYAISPLDSAAMACK